MDMQPDEDREPTEPAGEMPETQPTEVPAAASEAATAPEAAPEPEHRHLTSDEALAEMRRSLREEETTEKTGFRAGVGRFLNRLFRRKKPAPEPVVETPSRLDELEFPGPSSAAAPTAFAEVEPAAPEAGEAAPPAPAEAAAEGGAASEFRDLVRKRMTGALPGMGKMEPLVPTEPAASHEEAIDFLAPRTPKQEVGLEPAPPVEPERLPPGESILTALRKEDQEVAEQPSDLRQTALEDYVVAPEQPEEEVGGSLVRRLRRSWRDMRPLDRNLLMGALILIAVVFIAGSGYLVVQSLPTPTPALTPTTSVVPYPISLSLPGGWVFPLGIGDVVNGKWDPTGAEWLRGTEVCRWVSLPWTVQLEAVLRTLKADDALQLSMSNYDSIIYKVRSIQQVSPSEIQQLATDTPCLLVILTKSDSNTRWVVTAKP